MILRRALLEEIGLLDEGLYTYFDDVDMCIRSLRSGWTTWYVPESKVTHLEGASTGINGSAGQRGQRRPAYWFEARRRFFLKNYGCLRTALADFVFLCGLASWRLRRRLQHKVDRDPRQLLADSFRHSVFSSGFRLRDVKNPLLPELEPASMSK